MLKLTRRANPRTRTGLNVARLVRSRESSLIAMPLLIATILCSCGSPSDAESRRILADVKLQDGRTLRELSADSALRIVMVFSASECLSCASDLSGWSEMARRRSGRVSVVLTDVPPSEVRAALIRLRLSYSVVNPNDARWMAEATPAVLVFQGRALTLAERRMSSARRAFVADSLRKAIPSPTS
jgi:hypothetical protein